MAIWLAVLLVIGGTALLVSATLKAINVRRAELAQRSPFTLANWKRLHPELDPELLERTISAIAAGLEVEGHCLRPEDHFERSLALKGQLIIDDGTVEDVAESVKEQLGVEWNPKWQTVDQAVCGIVSCVAV